RDGAARPARARGGARDRAAGTAGDPPAHPRRAPRRGARGDPAAGPPAAAVRPARRGDPARAGHPRRERAPARSRRGRLLRARAGDLRADAPGAAAPPGPPTGRGGRSRRPASGRRDGRPRQVAGARVRTVGGRRRRPRIGARYALPVFGLTLTLAVYLLSYGLYHRLGRPGLLSPVLVSVVVIATVLQLTGMPYALYLEQVALLTLLLGP